MGFRVLFLLTTLMSCVCFAEQDVVENVSNFQQPPPELLESVKKNWKGDLRSYVKWDRSLLGITEYVDVDDMRLSQPFKLYSTSLELDSILEGHKELIPEGIEGLTTDSAWFFIVYFKDFPRWLYAWRKNNVGTYRPTAILPTGPKEWIADLYLRDFSTQNIVLIPMFNSYRIYIAILTDMEGNLCFVDTKTFTKGFVGTTRSDLEKKWLQKETIKIKYNKNKKSLWVYPYMKGN